MKICLVLAALLVAVAFGHNNDGGSYSAKKADKLSFKESLFEKIHSIKDKIHAKIATKKEKIQAKKAQKHGDSTFDKGAQPAADCSTVLDEVWEEQCGTKYEPSCRMEMQPHCTSIQAKECAPESQTRCSFVFEDKCKTISVPKCTIDWEKRCTSTPDCTTIEAKSCTDVEKDVCVTHMDKTCTMTTVNVCRKVAIRESTPVVDTAERVGLKASIKAKAAAHKAQKKGTLALKGLSKAHRFKRSEMSNGFENPVTHKACASPYFDCDDSKCHHESKFCDGNVDCDDGSDEIDHKCKKYRKEHNVTVSNETVSGAQSPNPVQDQEKIEDEIREKIEVEIRKNITGEIWEKIKDEIRDEIRDEIKNKTEDKGQNDYDTIVNEADKEEEEEQARINAQEKPVKEKQFKCKDGSTIKRSYRCDDIPDCLDESDEENCKPALRWDCVQASEDIRKDKEYNHVQKGKQTHAIRNLRWTKERAEWEYKTYPLDWTEVDRACGTENKQTNKQKRAAEEDQATLVESLETDIDANADYLALIAQSELENQDELVRLRRDAENDEHLEEALALARNPRSLKGDVSGEKSDFKGKLETFKAGFKAAKDQYHEAKAQFKATTKALIHAKLNKGPKGKGVKASVPTIRIRYEKSCQDEPRKICTKTPRQVCHKENVPLCKSEPRETCVQREKCKSWPTKNCGMVHKETCLPFPTKKCTEVSTPVCKIVPRQECTEKKREICETVPTKDCQKVLVTKPRTVCIPRPTTRTIDEW